MLRASRPVARAAVAAANRTTAMTQIRAAHTTSFINGPSNNKADPAIPGDATGFLPGDKITGDTQIGSYPALPMNNQQWRDGNASAGYWDRQDRRNFGETVRLDSFQLIHNFRNRYQKKSLPMGWDTTGRQNKQRRRIIKTQGKRLALYHQIGR